MRTLTTSPKITLMPTGSAELPMARQMMNIQQHSTNKTVMILPYGLSGGGTAAGCPGCSGGGPNCPGCGYCPGYCGKFCPLCENCPGFVGNCGGGCCPHCEFDDCPGC